MISDEEVGDFDKELLIREENMVVTVTHNGYIKRLPPSTYRAQGGEAGVSPQQIPKKEIFWSTCSLP